MNPISCSPEQEGPPLNGQFKPTTSFHVPTTWNLLSGINGAKVSRHKTRQMSLAQKAIDSNTMGAKHQLMAKREAARDYETKMAKLCTVWTDDIKPTAQSHTHGPWTASTLLRGWHHVVWGQQTRHQLSDEHWQDLQQRHQKVIWTVWLTKSKTVLWAERLPSSQGPENHYPG